MGEKEIIITSENEKEIIVLNDEERETFLKSMGIPSERVIRRRRHVVLIGIIASLVSMIAFCFNELKTIFFVAIREITSRDAMSVVLFFLPGFFCLGFLCFVFFIVKQVISGPRY